MTASFDASSTDVLDRYILAKTRELLESVTNAMDAYDLPGATASAQSFSDALTNWYVRRSRPRFWSGAADGNAADKQAAYNTLYTVLVVLSRTLAPLLPMVTEEIHQGLTGGDSVHLADWPDAELLPKDEALVSAMDRARDVCSAGLNLREDSGIGVRIPLAQLTVAGANVAPLQEFTDLIGDEINVKLVTLSDDLDAYASRVSQAQRQGSWPQAGQSYAGCPRRCTRAATGR